MLYNDTSEIEISELLEAIFLQYGYDFRLYSRAHINRRLTSRLHLSGLSNFFEMKEKLLADNVFASTVLSDLSITVTAMFRDPDFYKSIREKVIPVLKTYSFFKIWHAGCASGEEVYSMAILLKEEGLYDRATIYATDFNQHALDLAKDGIYSNSIIKEYTGNYLKSGARDSFSNYYISDSNMVIMDKSLKKNIVWANHNLVTDSVFAEVHLIICRNVMIYFNMELQNKVHQLFFDSLSAGGIIGLGSKESLRFTDFSDEYIELDRKEKIYKKKY